MSPEMVVILSQGTFDGNYVSYFISCSLDLDDVRML